MSKAKKKAPSHKGAPTAGAPPSSKELSDEELDKAAGAGAEITITKHTDSASPTLLK
jgi:hypothetical protein